MGCCHPVLFQNPVKWRNRQEGGMSSFINFIFYIQNLDLKFVLQKIFFSEKLRLELRQASAQLEASSKKNLVRKKGYPVSDFSLRDILTFIFKVE